MSEILLPGGEYKPTGMKLVSDKGVGLVTQKLWPCRQPITSAGTQPKPVAAAVAASRQHQ